MCAIQDEVAILKGRKLQDSQSTFDVLSNEKLLTNNCDVKQYLLLFCNIGKKLVTKKGD